MKKKRDKERKKREKKTNGHESTGEKVRFRKTAMALQEKMGRRKSRKSDK